MKTLFSRLAVMFFLVTSSAFAATPAAEDFKGEPNPAEFTLGVMGGLGIIDSTGGFALIGHAAKKIVNQGFVPDINNQVFIEAELGPMFTSGRTPFLYNAHLRWDFEKDATWTFFALGGVGGNATQDVASRNNRWTFHPRFGVGAFFDAIPGVTLRGEISHELTVVGVAFAL